MIPVPAPKIFKSLVPVPAPAPAPATASRTTGCFKKKCAVWQRLNQDYNKSDDFEFRIKVRTLSDSCVPLVSENVFSFTQN